MTLQEALDIVDEMKPNMMSRPLKLKYLTEIEQLIHDEIVMTHEHAEELDALLRARCAAFPELGMEALYQIRADRYPAIIAAAHGRSIYD